MPREKDEGLALGEGSERQAGAGDADVGVAVVPRGGEVPPKIHGLDAVEYALRTGSIENKDVMAAFLQLAREVAHAALHAS